MPSPSGTRSSAHDAAPPPAGPEAKELSELALRFAFGGSIAVLAHLVAHVYGPSIAGLFLAFPAILPATLTLVRDHAGPRQAAREALGALAGSVALALLAVFLWRGLASGWPTGLLLASAALLWLASAAFFWWLFLSREGTRD